MLRITYFYREPRKTGLSIEGIFHLVRKSLQGRAEIDEFYCDGSRSRWGNIQAAGRAAGKINHITGDVNFLAIGMRGKKNILTIHDLGYYENPVHSPFVKLVYRLLWFVLPLRNITIVTVVSEFTRQKVMQYFRFPATRIRVIPDPVKPIFQYSPKEPRGKKPEILMMGTGKHKNLDGLITAAKGLSCHLSIIGWPAPDELARLKEYNIEHTVYNGLTDEQVYERYKACDIMYIVSFYEGFGMPIIEAQAVGRPVITSSIGAMKEVATGSALLVDPNDTAAIRKAIESLSDSRYYYEMVTAGRANAAKYDYKVIADMYLAVYKELDAQQ